MLEFETSTGNSYAWIEDIGIFIPTNPALNAILKGDSNQNQAPGNDIYKKLKGNFDEKELKYYYDWVKKFDGVRAVLKERFERAANQHFTKDDLKNFLFREGFTQLILDVTEDCNFRCNYCIFSGNYVYYRSHSKKYMNIDIAKKAIDYYFSLIKEGKRYNPLRRPTVSFYGGEPLLNFKLIKECMEYIEDTYKDHKVRYSFTTNGSLLDTEKAEWFMKYDCHILISICGPKEEHDRLRVYYNGKGSFEDVMKNIKPIFENHRTKLGSIIVYDLKTDLFILDEFFKRHDVPPAILASPVAELEGGKYFEQFSETDRLMFRKQVQWAQKCYVNNFNSREKAERLSFFDLVFDEVTATIYAPGSFTLNSPVMPYSSACIPGKKLFVDIDGTFHICERVNRSFPIGNVADGLDFEKIRSTICEYNLHLDKCKTCEVKKMCTKCYANLSAGKKFMCTSKSCRTMESEEIRSLANAFTIAEINPKIIEKGLRGDRNVF